VQHPGATGLHNVKNPADGRVFCSVEGFESR
jgi:hypothetical protein